MTPAGEPRRKWLPGRRQLKALAMAAGLVLLVIGVRFLVVPERAAAFFGIGRVPGPYDLHYVIALRDLWLAALLIALAAMEEWRALAVTLGLGALVCFGDSAIVAASSGRALSIAFHVGSGVFCALLAWACWHRGRARQSG